MGCSLNPKWSAGGCLRIAMRIVRAHESETALMEIIVAIKGTLQKVMRVGHNPGLTVLTNTIGDGAIGNILTSGAC